MKIIFQNNTDHQTAPMLTEALKQQLTDLVAEGRLEDALQLLKENLRPLPDDFALLEARFQTAKRQYGLDLIDAAEFRRACAQCNQGFLGLLDSYEKNTGAGPEVKVKFSPKHQFTCDRSRQYNLFEPLLDEAANARIHYYYLYGDESAKHESLFRRFVNRTIGEEKSTGYTVVDISITDIGPDTDLNRLGLEFSKAILRELGNQECNWPKMPERSLAWGIANGEQTLHLGKNGKILLHLSITEALWDAAIVPGQVLTLIQNFCEKTPLPADGPEVFIFFSIEYSDENESIKKDIDTVMRQASYLKPMGELPMVTRDDVKNWFIKYRKKWENDEEREAARKDHFEHEPQLMYMDKVEPKLKKIIKDVNDSEKYEKR